MVMLLAAACGIVVANIYYAQPLIGLIGPDVGLKPRSASLIVSLTQLGYAAGLIFGLAQAAAVTPLAIAVHRFVLLGEARDGYDFNPGDWRFQRFFLFTIALEILGAIPSVGGLLFLAFAPILGSLVMLVLFGRQAGGLLRTSPALAQRLRAAEEVLVPLEAVRDVKRSAIRECFGRCSHT